MRPRKSLSSAVVDRFDDPARDAGAGVASAHAALVAAAAEVVLAGVDDHRPRRRERERERKRVIRVATPPSCTSSSKK